MRDHRVPAVLARLLPFLAAAVTMMPVEVSAQEVAGTLKELMGRTKIGQRLVVVDGGGREIKGKLRAISADSLTLESQGRPWKFTSQNLRLVQKPDPVWEGMAIGGAAGAAFGLWDYLIDPSEPGNAVFSVSLITVGVLAGAGIDALIGGTKTLFVAQPNTGGRPILSLRPVASARTRGIAVTLRF